MPRGFTLIETLVVITLVIMLALMGSVVTLFMLRAQALSSNADLMVSQIAVAQMNAYSQKDDASHGIKIDGNTLTRFTGDSYLTRTATEDVSLEIPVSITLSGDDEVVFSKGGVRPGSASTIQLTSTDEYYVITVSAYGVMEVTKGTTEP